MAVGYHVVPIECPVTFHDVPKKVSGRLCPLSSKPLLLLHALSNVARHVSVGLADLFKLSSWWYDYSGALYSSIGGFAARVHRRGAGNCSMLDQLHMHPQCSHVTREKLRMSDMSLHSLLLN